VVTVARRSTAEKTVEILMADPATTAARRSRWRSDWRALTRTRYAAVAGSTRLVVSASSKHSGIQRLHGQGVAEEQRRGEGDREDQERDEEHTVTAREDGAVLQKHQGGGHDEAETLGDPVI